MFPPTAQSPPQQKLPYYQPGIDSQVIINYVVGEITRHNNDPAAHANLMITGGAIATHREVLGVVALGQTMFSMSAQSTTPHLSALYVNGVKAFFGLEYSINAIASTLNWLGVTLEISDSLEIFYQ